jgi:hypothetical protein
MLISTKSTVYRISSGATNSDPEILVDTVGIRRVLEGQNLDLIALDDGNLILIKGERKKTLHSGIEDRIDSLLVIEEDPVNLLIGCTPPNMYRLLEGKNSAFINSNFDELEVREKWFTPWGGPPAVRSMAKNGEGWIYADIHVGSIMRSKDEGETWGPVVPDLHRDVHEVSTSKIDPDMVYANTYNSVFVSHDRGDSWKHRNGVLNSRYGRGIDVHPTNPEILLCGVSDGPHGDNVHGQLYWTDNAGEKWEHVYDGFPSSTKKNIDTFHIAFYDENKAWVTDENTLYLSEDSGRTFEAFWEAPEEISMISVKQ